MILVIDYISPIWSLKLFISLINKFNIPQKIERQAIIRILYMVSSLVVEFEAGLVISKVRHHKQ